MKFFTRKKPTVLVGMSGGVDSSVSAALLKKRGFRVVGGFIKNWSDSKDVWTGECQWRGERRDAMRVAAKLDIPLLTFDFENEYRERVLGELFRGYEAGDTPNPDVLCNEAIKFGLFFEAAKRIGADFIATGHYARVTKDWNGNAHLLRGMDPEKDQSYFLYRVSQEALQKTVFPIGDLAKPKVREFARRMDIPVAEKPDSQGICFIGKLDMSDFLRTRIPSKPGEIVDAEGNVLGQHSGLDQYTIGQRHGIRLAADHAWYVAKKDHAANRLVVVNDSEHPLLFTTHAEVRDLRWTGGTAPKLPLRVDVQVRYRQSPTSAVLRTASSPGRVALEFETPVKAVASGQSAVFYKGSECLGGGVLA